MSPDPRTMVIKNGELSITGPYNATIQFKDFTLNQRGKNVKVDGNPYEEEIDNFVSGTISITYQNNAGNELGSHTYNVSPYVPSALIATSENAFLN